MTQTPKSDDALRLNRFLARAGHGSRRGVEALISAGRVRVNGVVTTDLATRITPGSDQVEVDGIAAVTSESFAVYAFHKPRGVVCTLVPQRQQIGLASFRDDAGLPARIMPVGRLDSDSSGLLLWTDDGDLAQALCRPGSGVWKAYEVVLDREPTTAERRAITEGTIRLDGRPCLPARLTAGARPELWLLELHEGRNRQIRRMFARLGLKVRRLRRVAVGLIRLGRLGEGDFRSVNEEDERALRETARPQDPDSRKR